MNTKTILIGLIGSIFLLILMLLVFSLLSKDVPTESDQTVVLPEVVDVPDREYVTPKTIEINAANNLKFEVYNFVDNGETVEDPVNQGIYILAGDTGYCLSDGSCPSGFDSDSFSISYSEKDDFFTLAILQEPIAESRKEAQSFLMSRLGVSEQEMCLLHYSFSVPYWVNEFFSGKELRFSFCPGSVSLE